MKQYQLVIFDWDGTITNSIPLVLKCAERVAKENDLPIPSLTVIKKSMGLGNVDFGLNVFPGLDPTQAMDLFYKYYLAEKGNTEQLYPKAKETLNALFQRGKKLAVATNKYRISLEKSLKDFQIDHLFSAVRCGDDQYFKPDPLVIVGILEELGMNSDQSVMIGDSIYDMQLARNAKVDAIAVTYGAHFKEDLISYQPVACIDDIHELLNIVK
jgi:phosphoglycolate phosphatase